MTRRRRIYIAGPYSNGETQSKQHVEANVMVARATARELVVAGFHPVTPHLTHYIDNCPCLVDAKITYERWMEHCLADLETCDCVLRLRGDSKGADRECCRAVDLEMPIYRTVKELVEASR